MPRKPERNIIEAAKVKLNPHDVLSAVLNDPECEELQKELLRQGLIKEEDSNA